EPASATAGTLRQRGDAARGPAGRRHARHGRAAACVGRMTASLRAFLVDDEPLALKRLARLLEATGRVEIVGRATDPARALAQLASAAPDVVFLDIHMPGLSGLQVAERVPARAMVVFTTAYEQHAVAAFEVNAVDYLLKPIVRERL